MELCIAGNHQIRTNHNRRPIQEVEEEAREALLEAINHQHHLSDVKEKIECLNFSSFRFI
jgi:hypothetical protein